MACRHCKCFLEDFITGGLHPDHPLFKKLRIKRLHRILPEVSSWLYRIYMRVNRVYFDDSLQLAMRISRRDRKIMEYEALISTACFRFLKYKEKWIPEEVSYLTTILLEASVLKQVDVDDYICYMSTRTLAGLYELHKEHSITKKDDEKTCIDPNDNYQKEILLEEDDLYT
jgi:hypothetical protein